MIGDLPNWFSYFVVFLFGALSVAVFARRQFEADFDLFGERGPDLLATVPIDFLAGGRSFGRGLIFYITAFEAAYFVLCSSSALLSIALDYQGGNPVDAVGPIAPTDDAGANGAAGDARGDIGSELAIPLIVSSLIISFAKVPGISQIENLVRSLAYGAAGIPRNIYFAMEKLRGFDMLKDAYDVSPSTARAKEKAAQIRQVALDAGVHDSTAQVVSRACLAIYALSPWIDGTLGPGLWSERTTRGLSPVTGRIVPAVRVAKTKLEDAMVAGNVQATDWETMAQEMRSLASDVEALFCIFAINNRGASPGIASPLVTELLKEIHSGDENRALNTVIGTLIWGGVLGLIVAFLVRLLTHLGMSRQIEADVESAILSRAFFESMLDKIPFALGKAPTDVAVFVAIFAIAALTALSIRENRIEHRKWTSYSGGTGHYSEYLIISLLATFIVLLPVYVLISAFAELMLVETNVGLDDIREQVQLDRFRQSLPDVLVGLPIAWSAMKFADMQEASARAAAAGETGAKGAGGVGAPSLLELAVVTLVGVWLANRLAAYGTAAPEGTSLFDAEYLVEVALDLILPATCYVILLWMLALMQRRAYAG